MERKIKRFTKLYPWYAGLTGDLLFYIAINTLFLTVTKGFSSAEIVSADTVGTVIGILFQFPVLRIIQRIGNTASLRVSASLLLLSAILLTLAPNYAVMLLGRICHTLAFVFQSVGVVMLENNLDLADRRLEFVRIRTAAKTVYAALTMAIAFIAAPMFNFHQYLPMVGCLITCTIGLILAFFMVDLSPYNKIRQKTSNAPIKLRFTKLLVLCTAAYGLFYATVGTGQTEGKLFIQEALFEHFNVENASLILGGIVCVSRIVRVVSNLVFVAVYTRHPAPSGVILATLLCVAIGCILFGSFFPLVWLKIAAMGLGYIIILFIGDLFVIYIHNIIFNNTTKEHHQIVLTVLSFSTKVAKALMGLAFTWILLGHSLTVVMGIIFAIGLVQFLVVVALYRNTLKFTGRGSL